MSLNSIIGLGSIGATLSSAFFGKDKKSSTSSTTQSTNSHTDSTSSSTRQYGEQQFNDEILGELEGLLSGQLGKAGETTDFAKTRLEQLSDRASAPMFDSEKYAEEVTGQAASAAGLDLDSTINSILSQTGTSETGNSMSALLANKLRNQTAANLAGVNASARSTGEQIRLAQENSLTSGIQGLSDSVSNQILALVSGVKGARSAGTSTDASESQQDTVSKSTGITKSDSSSKDNPFDSFVDLFSILGKSSGAA
jgi:hypothetical protein